MHELSITMNILDIAEENARNLNAKIVHEIEIDIGEMSGVDTDALQFAMQCTTKSELLESAKLVINKIPAKARCYSCNHEFDISDFYTECPNCNGFNHDIYQGKELKIVSIKID
jgi:hydrogenase nickel incorporation protein HypA/HybF